MNKTIFIAVVQLLACFALQAQEKTTPNPADQVLMDTFKKHVSTLASEEFEGRAPMTKGDTLAFNYIRDHFKSLPGVELLGKDGLQEFGFGGLRIIIKDSTYLRLNDKILRYGKDYIPSCYSFSGDFEGETVYIGAGEKEDYEGKDLTGKVIIIDGALKEGEKVTDALFRKGALAEKANVGGILVITPDFPKDSTSWGLSSRLKFAYVKPAVAEKAKKGVKVSGSAKIERGTEQQILVNNIVARIAAPVQNNPDKECIVIGAHFDHMGITVKDTIVEKRLGADDNASGTATLMELASYYSKNRDKLKRDIVLVSFAAEERGLKGSAYFAANPLVPLNTIKAMVNFDMTGRMNKNTIHIRGIGSSVEPFSILAAMPNPDLLNLSLVMTGQAGTDYASFNRAGVPAVSFSTGLHPDYHSPRDTEDKINYQGMVKLYNYVVPFISRFALEKSTLTLRPDWK